MLPVFTLSRPCHRFPLFRLANWSGLQQWRDLQYRRYLLPIPYVYPILLFYILLWLPRLMLSLLRLTLSMHRRLPPTYTWITLTAWMHLDPLGNRGYVECY